MNPYDFLNDPDVDSCFAELDYLLRSGVHVQRQFRGQHSAFRFLQKNFESLGLYYKNLFGLSLEERGVDDNRYYYLDATEDIRSKVPYQLRKSLKKEFALLGIFLCKLRIDLSDVETVAGFKKALREEYEAYKNDFFRLLAYATSDNRLDSDEQAVDKWIDTTLTEFHKIGWIYREHDRFEIMPSLERLRLLYIDEINNIDELINHEQS